MTDEAVRRKPLTVGELRALLEGRPDDMPVYTEGCDCVGPACGVEETVLGTGDEHRSLIVNRDDSIWRSR